MICVFKSRCITSYNVQCWHFVWNVSLTSFLIFFLFFLVFSFLRNHAYVTDFLVFLKVQLVDKHNTAWHINLITFYWIVNNFNIKHQMYHKNHHQKYVSFPALSFNFFGNLLPIWADSLQRQLEQDNNKTFKSISTLF